MPCSVGNHNRNKHQFRPALERNLRFLIFPRRILCRQHCISGKGRGQDTPYGHHPRTRPRTTLQATGTDHLRGSSLHSASHISPCFCEAITTLPAPSVGASVAV